MYLHNQSSFLDHAMHSQSETQLPSNNGKSPQSLLVSGWPGPSEMDRRRQRNVRVSADLRLRLVGLDQERALMAQGMSSRLNVNEARPKTERSNGSGGDTNANAGSRIVVLTVWRRLSSLAGF